MDFITCFTDEERGSEKVNDQLKITHLEWGKAWARDQICWIESAAHILSLAHLPF